MPAENFQQPQDGAILFLGQNLGVKVSFARFAQINVHAPVNQSFGGLIEAKFRGLIQQHLSRLQKSNELIADANRHGGIGETGETSDGARTIADFLCQLALHFQAGGTGPIRSRHQLAKRVFVSGAAHDGLPMLNGAQGDQHSRCVRKGARVIAINCGARQFLDQLLVAKLHQPQPYRSQSGCRCS